MMHHPGDSADLRLLQPLFPAGVHSVFSANPPQDFPLYPDEQRTTARMAPQRYRDFCHGRACGRLALEHLGWPDCPIPVGEHREPVWPDGVVGSLSHTGHCAAAVVAPAARIWAVGIDLEPWEPLPAEILTRICRPEEIHRLRSGEAPDHHQAKIIFSAKESLYKCLWPHLRTFISFHEMEIMLAGEKQSWTAKSHTDKCASDLIRRLQGRYRVTDGLIVSSACILPVDCT